MTEPVPVIDPSQIGGYLQSKGWIREGNWRGAGVWSLESSRQLLVPDHREYDDDSELIQEAVRRLAAYEERPEGELLLDISEPMVDTQFFRTHPNSPAGTIGLPSGVRATRGVHDLLSTAARTVEEGPQLLFEGRRSSRVDSLLHRIMLGAARPGSYVLTTRVPVGQSQQPLTLWDSSSVKRQEEALDGRAMLSALNRAIRAAQKAANILLRDARSASGFDDQAEQGVSANLCRALGDLGGYSRDRPVEIGFTWARGLPSQVPTDPVAFTGSMVAVLSRAADELEQLARSGQAQITGQVETLNISPGQQPRIKVVGELRTATQVISRRAIWVAVSMGEYDQAIEAHRVGWRLEVAGTLVTSQRRLEMRPHRFAVLRQ
jgi:hypothetical protein